MAGYIEYVNSMQQFIKLKEDEKHVVRFALSYADMAEDLIAGLLLSQIVYWYMEPAKDGLSKLRVRKAGYMWFAKQQNDWWDETRLTPKQIKRALTILESKKLIVIEYHRFKGFRTTHVRINDPVFLKAYNDTLNNPPDNPHKKTKDPERW